MKITKGYSHYPKYMETQVLSNDICDVTQWNLEIKLHNSNRISKCGSNEYATLS